MIMKLLEEVHRGELVQGKVRGLLRRNPRHRNFEDLPGLAVRIVHRVEDDDFF
jgi:hypothetical protein